jgi:hypothetical protein
MCGVGSKNKVCICYSVASAVNLYKTYKIQMAIADATGRSGNVSQAQERRG